MRRVLRLAFTVPLVGLTALAAAQPRPQRGAERARTAVVEIPQVRVVAAAIDSLPKPLKEFYKTHRVEMPSQALEPEFPPRTPERRFLVDRLLPFPFAELPRSEAALKSRYGEKAEGVGRLPWLIQDSYARLVEAMKAQDKPRILTESDVLASLVLDLHTVVNLTDDFDGQKTGQHGLYVRFTEKLPQWAAHDLKLSPEAARYLDDPKEFVFSMLSETYVWLDNVLYLEDLAKRGKPGYGDIYFEDFAKRVAPILRDQFSRAAEDAGSYWYTAWTVAGRPDLH